MPQAPSCLQDASEIVSFCTALRRRNEATAREVDAIFMERQEREKGTHRLEEQVSYFAVRWGLVPSFPAASLTCCPIRLDCGVKG